jgi:hypothetical protein
MSKPKIDIHGTHRTSLNQIPAMHRRLASSGELMDMHVLDYGCGRNYEEIGGYILLHGASGYTPHDPYWIPTCLLGLTVDVVLCSNVLNVIAEPDELCRTLSQMASMAPVAYVSVYGGDKSGRGRVTSRGYQRNEPINAYVDVMSHYWDEVEVLRRTIIAKRGKV